MRSHIRQTDVEQEARDAEPRSDAEAQALEQAEQQGRARARGEEPELDDPGNIRERPAEDPASDAR